MSPCPRTVQTTSMITAWLIAACLIALAGPPPAAAQAEPQAGAQDAAPSDQVRKGRLAFNNNCRTCHSTKEGDNRLGPSLHGIFGDKAGSEPGYAAYSQAMRSSEIVWDEETLDRFIENPDAVVPNNNMNPYTGIADPEVRQQIIAYLKAQSASD